MAEHSPGPWKLCHHLESAKNDAACSCGYRGGIWGADGNHIICEIGCAIAPGEEGMEPARYPREVELENAALIVRAPELLEMMERFREDLLRIAFFVEPRWQELNLRLESGWILDRLSSDGDQK